MSSPWQVLGIAPGSSVAEVKKAYARLLRQHRPDQDPVGFRRLRDAYELAVQMAESGIEWPEPEDGIAAEDENDEGRDAEPSAGPGRAARPTSDRATDHSSAGDFPDMPRAQREPGLGKARIEVAAARPRDLAEALRHALARVRAAPQPAREQRLLRLLASLLHRHPHDFALGELAREELDREGDGLRRLVPPEVAFGVRTVDGSSLGRALLLAHLAANDLTSFFGAVDAMARSLDAAAEPARLSAALDAASIVALLDPARAERLADLVFQNAPPGLRTASCDVDAFVQAGRQLREKHLREHLPAVVLALHDPRVGDNDPRAHRVLDFVVAAARAPDLAAIAATRFPTVWPGYEPKWRRNRASRTKRPQQPARRSFGRYLVVIWLVLFVLGGIVRTCGSDRPPKFRIERIEKLPRSTFVEPIPESPR